jgi:hypothetical protein
MLADAWEVIGLDLNARSVDASEPGVGVRKIHFDYLIAISVMTSLPDSRPAAGRPDRLRNQESGGTLSVGFTQKTVAHVRVRALASARLYRTARLSVWRSDANCTD